MSFLKASQWAKERPILSNYAWPTMRWRTVSAGSPEKNFISVDATRVECLLDTKISTTLTPDSKLLINIATPPLNPISRTSSQSNKHLYINLVNLWSLESGVLICSFVWKSAVVPAVCCCCCCCSWIGRSCIHCRPDGETEGDGEIAMAHNPSSRCCHISREGDSLAENVWVSGGLRVRGLAHRRGQQHCGAPAPVCSRRGRSLRNLLAVARRRSLVRWQALRRLCL